MWLWVKRGKGNMFLRGFYGFSILKSKKTLKILKNTINPKHIPDFGTHKGKRPFLYKKQNNLDIFGTRLPQFTSTHLTPLNSTQLTSTHLTSTHLKPTHWCIGRSSVPLAVLPWSPQYVLLSSRWDAQSLTHSRATWCTYSVTP